MKLTQEMVDTYYDADHEDRYKVICELLDISYRSFLQESFDGPVRKAVLDMELELYFKMPSDKRSALK